VAKDSYNHFIISIEDFYSTQKRDLPWRKAQPVPYEVWLSEIILQQTRVAQGTPYFVKILAAFPTVIDLAEASEDELLALWTGLGYYSRARNLQKGARQIVAEFGGEIPNNFQSLIKIAGIGPYTAAAISSICFGERKGVVDGNVYRVLSRYFGIHTPVNSTAGVKEFQNLADALIQEAADPKNYNQGIMEFGSLQCTPKKPACQICPLQDFCIANQSGTTAQLPVKIKKGKRSKETIHFAVINDENRWALYKRDHASIWGGLYEFPRLVSAPKNAQLLQGPVVHKLSHKDLFCHFWEVDASHCSEPFEFYTKEEITHLGMPIIVSDFVKKQQ